MIFVDTWAWVALAVKRDQYHKKVKQAHAQFSKQKRTYVTTDYVLSELITYLYTVGSVTTAEQFIDSLLASVDSGKYQLVTLSPDQFRRAWRMRKKYHDKPDVSFVDFTSMVVLQDLGITEVFTGDHHFLQVGLGFPQLAEKPLGRGVGLAVKCLEPAVPLPRRTIMAITVEAVYENGVLRPKEPLPLKEHETVQITIHPKISLARQTAGMIPWTGDLETLERIATDPEFGIRESR